MFWLNPWNIKITQSEKMDTPCWEWQGGKTKSGYGAISIVGRNVSVHRLVYQLYIGSIKGNLFVCHKCDNKICCNPEHLFIGTAKQNTEDMVAKGRNHCGDRHHRSKLTEARVKELRTEFMLGEISYGAMARRENVTRLAMSRAIRGKTWKCVERELCKK